MPAAAGASAPAQGFTDPVHQAQRVFRTAMQAMARPGSILELPSGPKPPAGLGPGMAAMALTLCDFETPIFLDERLAARPEIAAFLRFHTGAPIVQDLQRAAFALIGAAAALPRLDGFAQGSLEFPDRSTTLLIEVEALAGDVGWRLAGPGILGSNRFHAAPLPEDFLDQLAVNRALFPRGVDIYFLAGRRLAALPRSTAVVG